MAVVYLVLGTPPVLDVVAVAFLSLHYPVDGTRGAVLVIIVKATSEVSLFALADGAGRCSREHRDHAGS
jgi:hypothetical protein